MNQRLILITLFLILQAIPYLGLGQKIRFYNSEQGLPNSLIHRVSQDKDGYIWLATENGASCFDGMRFTTFRHEKNKPGTLASDLAKIIYTDSRGVIWVGTSNGLQIFDREKNVFLDFPLQCPSFNVTPYVTSILETKDKKYLLVSVSGYGIMVYDDITHQIDLDATQKLKELYGYNFLGNLFIDSEGFVWSFSEQGSFFKLNFESKALERINWDPEISELSGKIAISTMAEDPVTKNILIGSYNHGIFVYDRTKGFIRKPKGKSASKIRIRVLLAETRKNNGNEQNIWVGSEDFGLKKFDRTEEEIVKPDFQYASIDLDNCKVHSIMQDNQGNIWAGIFQKGLLIIPKTANDFEYIKLSETQGSMSVNIACITAITRDNNRDFWVGTDGGGLFKISKDGRKTRYTTQNTPLPNNAILALAVDKRGTLWISTYMGGVTTYHPNSGFKTYSNEPDLQKVICLLYDNKQDKLYLGTLGLGVKVLSFSNNQLESFPNPQELGWTSSLCLDNSGTLCIGRSGGLRCFNTLTGEMEYTELSEKLKEITINSSLLDKDGSIWLGSVNGLYHYQKESNKLTLYSKADGLPSNLVCSILQDANGILWISTISGLSQFNPRTSTFKNFYVYDGLQDNEFRMKSSHMDPDGKMFFGGINGITAFYPAKIQGEEKFMSKIYFSQLTVLNHRVNYDENLGKKNILDRHITQAHQITLKKNQNVFSLEFAVLEYANPQKVVYGYMLKGFDKDWQFTDASHRTATYTNLPEGFYTFHVKAFFEGSSNEQNVVYNEINIRILPPWYKSWWAYLIYLTLFMLVVWEFVNYLIGRKLRIQERKEFEKKEMKLQMFTDLAHEIRTPFTLVISPLKTLQETETDSKKKEMLNLINRNALRILRLLNQIMDMRKIDNHQFKMHFQKTDLIFFISDIMKSFEQLAIMRNIEFRLVSNLESLDVWIDEANFDKVLYNILSNAFKYTPDNGYVMISLNALGKNLNAELRNNTNGQVELCIENSGSKIEENETERIFERFYQSNSNSIGGGSGVGLHLAKMIIELHHGKIKAKNTENGVAFIINIPLGTKHLSPDEITSDSKSNDSSSSYRHTSQLSQETDYVELPEKEGELVTSKGNRSNRSVVFVDDDVDLGKYIRMELSEKFNIETYSDAREAWKVISTTLPDAVITDLLMPEVDGISLCKKIRQNPETNHLPIIILTAETNEESEQTCIECGADHYLTKPINLDLLKSTVAQAIQTRDTIRNKYRSNFTPNFDEVKISSPDSRLITKVIETIRKNIENPEFSVDDLSREVGLSRVHLNRKLKENINISPSNLIKSIRLKQAAYLLINNKVNISDVAYKVGFSSHSYFSNNFKEYFGMAPTEFVTKYTESDEKETLNKLFEN
ncbi:MAG TPA: two-component regulator propeller domain-containing protein [Prolixibacteraceae bacterium]|nr:two-component regulator propeller domain-containing protein [Prolixibacteraceae bacterium]HPS12835.1 two-component regulator propeller domain-containing protein [Prolixibacteraceae bacterium]